MQAYVRRWAALLAVAAQRALAASLLQLPLFGETCVDGAEPPVSDLLADAIRPILRGRSAPKLAAWAPLSADGWRPARAPDSATRHGGRVERRHCRALPAAAGRGGRFGSVCEGRDPTGPC